MLSADLFRERRSQLAKVVLLLCAVYFALAFAGQAWKAKALGETLLVEQAGLQKQQATNEELRARLEFLNGPGYDVYVEKMAREKLGFARPGDHTLFVVPDQQAPGHESGSPLVRAEPQPVVATPQQPVWRQWARVFFP